MTYTIFGESHGPAIGVVLEGVPSGVEMDLDFIRAELQRRAPGKSALTTARKEADEPEILSGVFDGKTTGTPLCAIIRNTDTRSKDYAKLKHLPRPSHADYAGAVRYGGFNDYRGGGHFSGRLTAPLVFAGALAKLILQEKGVIITSAISILEGTPDPSPEEIEEIILAARKAGDSVGGAISCTVTAGFGAPDFGCNAEGIFAQHLFAVPAVKGIAFGAGFGFSCMRGSEANDPFYMEEGQVKTRTNASGGINGGITNGMPIVFEVAIRPTPSIAMEQNTVDLAEKKDATLVIEGRHDPCIVQRALPVVEAAAALASCELLGL